MSKNDLEILKEFINDKEAQEKFNAIKNSVMDFNIFEITGLGNQEIKHSNTPAWLFGDNEHGLKYQILERFLYTVSENKNNISLENNEMLKTYIRKLRQGIIKDIKILREKYYKINNRKYYIDIMIVDGKGNYAITIEHKIEASESDKQLSSYREIVRDQYEKFIPIFLTKDGRLPEDESEQQYWLTATHSMVGQSLNKLDISKLEDVFEELCKNYKNHSLHNKDLLKSIKAQIILLSYIELLRKENFMVDKKLQKLCSYLWYDYEKALDILIKNRLSKIDRLFKFIADILKENHVELGEEKNFYPIKTKNTNKLYNFINGSASTINKYAIDFQMNKWNKPEHMKEYIWIGYYCETVKDKDKDEKEKINQLKEKFGMSSNELELKRIDKSDIENLDICALRHKAQEISNYILKQMDKFDKKIEKALKELQGQKT